MIPKTAAALKRFAVRKGSIGNNHPEEKCQYRECSDKIFQRIEPGRPSQ